MEAELRAASHVPVAAEESDEAYFARLKESFDRYLRAFVQARVDNTGTEGNDLSVAIAFVCGGGGKRIRPLLTLATTELYRPLDEGAFALAAATELIHAASLVLDDLPSMDNATCRRGRPASHLVYGESTTILAALALWSEAVRLLATVEGAALAPIVRAVADNVGQDGLVRGQFLDLASFGRSETLADLETCAALKTGSLFKNAAELGAAHGAAPEAESSLLARFGQELGIAFQIRDDIIDAESSREAAGKDVGIDARNRRPTFASVLGLAEARALVRARGERLRGMLAAIPRDTRRLSALVHDVEAVY